MSRLIPAVLIALAVGCSSDGREPLVIYSPHGKEMLAYYEQAFEAANPGVDVQWVDMGSQEVLDRLRAESANPQADLWFGAPAEAFSKGAKAGLLAPYRPSFADAVPADARDEADLWYGMYLTPEVIAYNTAAVPAAEAPKPDGVVVFPDQNPQSVSPSERAILERLQSRRQELEQRAAGAEALGLLHQIGADEHHRRTHEGESERRVRPQVSGHARSVPIPAAADGPRWATWSILCLCRQMALTRLTWIS